MKLIQVRKTFDLKSGLTPITEEDENNMQKTKKNNFSHFQKKNKNLMVFSN